MREDAGRARDAPRVPRLLRVARDLVQEVRHRRHQRLHDRQRRHGQARPDHPPQRLRAPLRGARHRAHDAVEQEELQRPEQHALLGEAGRLAGQPRHERRLHEVHDHPDERRPVEEAPARGGLLQRQQQDRDRHDDREGLGDLQPRHGVAARQPRRDRRQRGQQQHRRPRPLGDDERDPEPRDQREPEPRVDAGGDGAASASPIAPGTRIRSLGTGRPCPAPARGTDVTPAGRVGSAAGAPARARPSRRCSRRRRRR